MDHRQSGVGLLEVILAAAILLVMVWAVGTLSLSGTEAAGFSQRLARATEVNQDVSDGIRLELMSSARIFGDDPEGNSNLGALDLAGAPPMLPGSRLPRIMPNGAFQKDVAGNEIAGNVLLFARHAWTDRFVATSGREYLTDVYRWVAFYLTSEGNGPQQGVPYGLNLVRVATEPMADGWQIDRILDPTDQTELLSHLVEGTADANGVMNPPVEVVWLRGWLATDDGAFRHIEMGSGAMNSIPFGDRPWPWRIQRATPEVTGLLAYRHLSVATNHARRSMGVGRFGRVSNGGSGFPHGFEVQVVGPSASRQVMLHLVLASTVRRGQTAWSDLQTVIDARDL